MKLQTAQISRETATRLRPKNKPSESQKSGFEVEPEPRADSPVLLVDDSKADTELFRIILKKRFPAATFIAARDGAEALDMLFCRGVHAGGSRLTPSLIVLDIKMPRIDGLETLKAIRQNVELAATPVVIFTASKQEREIETALKLGADAFVTKPTSFKELQIAIDHILSFRIVQKAVWA